MRLKKIWNQGRIKWTLLCVLFVSVSLLGFSFFYIAARNHELVLQVQELAHSSINTVSPDNSWIYSVCIIALALSVCAIIFLVRETGVKRKLAEGQVRPEDIIISGRPGVVHKKENGSFITGVINSLDSHIAVINSAGEIIKTNTAWNRFVEANGESAGIPGECTNYFDMVSAIAAGNQSDEQTAINGIKAVMAGDQQDFYYEYSCSLPQGKKWFFMRATRFEIDETLLVIEHCDITERKKAEVKTQEAIERYEFLSLATSDAIWEWDLVNSEMAYNSGITKMFGYKIAEVNNIFEWWQENIHPDDLSAALEIYSEAVKKSAGSFQQEYRFRASNGKYKNILDRAFVIYDADKKPVRIIGSMQDITSRKAEEKRISKAIMLAQEKERRYIGLELHDNINQILASSILCIGLVKDNRTDAEKVLTYADMIKTHTLNAIDEIRKLSHELAPPSFDGNTLRSSFENLLKSINLDNRYIITFTFDEDVQATLDEDVQLNLYRILQEQAKNILKYSDASIVDVSVSFNNNGISMRIRDNGKGFDMREVKSGIGICNMKRRAEAVGGRFALRSQPSGGCEVVVQVPAVRHRK